MGRSIVKLADDAYVEWGSIVEAPVTYVMTRDMSQGVSTEREWARCARGVEELADGLAARQME